MQGPLAESRPVSGSSSWPEKREVLGVPVSITDYEESLELVLRAARARRPTTVDHMAVHDLMEAVRDPAFLRRIRAFDIVAPDGQPVRWALNRLWGARLSDRVYGPELMKRICARAAEEGIGIYLYGSSPQVLDTLCARLVEQYPGIHIAGAESPPFRALTPVEDRTAVERINGSGAGIVFVGLGCPKQEIFADEHRESIRAVQLCVGAAFDFLAGSKKMAPRWMQKRGLEWLFRMLSEPRRLTARYLKTNSLFAVKIARELVFSKHVSRSRIGDAQNEGVAE